MGADCPVTETLQLGSQEGTVPPNCHPESAFPAPLLPHLGSGSLTSSPGAKFS